MNNALTRFLELSFEDQDYLRSGLITQLLNATLLNRAHEVLVSTTLDGSTNIWESIRITNDDFTGYISDIHRIWSAMERSEFGYADKGATSTCIWYAALLASQVSRATTLPPRFALALCVHNIWSGEAGISYALRLIKREDRGQFLLALRPSLSEELAILVDQELRIMGIDNVNHTENDELSLIDSWTYGRTQIDDSVEFEEEFLEVIEALGDSTSKTIKNQLPRARRIAKQPFNRGKRVAGLAEIALYLQRKGELSSANEMWEHTIEYAGRIKNKHERVFGYRQILSRLTPNSYQIDDLFTKGYNAAMSLANVSERAEALLRLSIVSPKAEASSLVDNALALIDTLKTPVPQTQLLILASRILSGSARQQVAERAARRILDISDRETQMQMCLELLNQLDDLYKRESLLIEVVRKARIIGDYNECMYTLSALSVGKTGKIEKNFIDDLLKRLKKVKDCEVRSDAIQIFASILTASQRKKAYKLVTSIPRGARDHQEEKNKQVAKALWAVARNDIEPERTRFWKQAWDISHLSLLVLEAPLEYLGEVWEMALVTKLNNIDHKLVMKYRDQLSLEGQVKHWEAARENLMSFGGSVGLRGISNDWFIRTWVPEKLFEDYLAQERGRLIREPGGDAYSNISCFARLFCNVSDSCMQKALAFAQGLPDPYLRLCLYEPLAERMRTEGALLAKLSLAAFDEIDNSKYYLDELIKVMVNLSTEHRSELLIRIQEGLPHQSYRSASTWISYFKADLSPSKELVELAWQDWERLRGKGNLGHEAFALSLYPHLDEERAGECEPDLRLLAQSSVDSENVNAAKALLSDKYLAPQPWEDAWKMLLREPEPHQVLKSLVDRIEAGNLPERPMPAHIWQSLLRRYALSGREKLLELLNTVASVIELVVGPHARSEAFSAVSAVMKWWE